MLRFAVENGCPWDAEVVLEAAKESWKAEVVAWVHAILEEDEEEEEE